MQIYVHRDGQEFGPFSPSDVTEQLQAGTLVPDDLAWYEGCAEWIPLSTVGAVPSRPAFPPPPVPQSATLPRAEHSDVLGYALLGISAAAALMIWRASELRISPFVIALAAVLSTGVLAGIEAKRLGVGSATDRTPKGRRRSGPAAWAAFVVILWTIGFPSYLYWRSRYGARNLVIPAVVVVMAFLAAPYLPGSKVGMDQLQVGSLFQDEPEGPSAEIIKSALEAAMVTDGVPGGPIDSVTDIKRGEVLVAQDGATVPAGTTIFPIKATMHFKANDNNTIRSLQTELSLFYYRDSFGEWKCESARQ